MRTFNIKEENILRRLEDKYHVQDVEYNIITSNFVYYKDGEKKHISLESLVKYLEHVDTNDKELFTVLNELHASYFPRRIKEYFEEFYKDVDVKLPRDIFIVKGFIGFVDVDGDIFYLPFEDNLGQVFDKAKKYMK